jgi:hypothetical protein
MQVQITETLNGKHAVYVEAVCGKVTGRVSVYHDGRAQVICKNAAHECWRGMGRQFRTITEALAGYRSGEMKAIIQAAVDFAAMPAPAVTH